MKSYRDIAGDGGSRIVEQVAAQRRRREQALAGVRQLLAVGSGKGGVGKSTLARQLALALDRRGRRVALLDADLNGPSQARLAGLGAVPLVPLDGRLAMPRGREGFGIVSLGTQLAHDEAVEFASPAAGDSHVWRATREFAFLDQLMSAVDWGELDYLVVDLPPGAERTFQYAEFLGAAAAFVLVTIPSGLSREVVARSAAALGRTPNRVLGYVENMSGYACPGCGGIRPLFAPTDGDALPGLPLLGRVPFDPELSAPAAGPLPAVREIAARLEAALAAEEAS